MNELNGQQGQGQNRQNGLLIYVMAKLTMNMNEIHKKIHSIDLKDEVNYLEYSNLRLSYYKDDKPPFVCATIIPITKFINFYRILETTKSNLAEAITCPESIDFLTACKSEKL